MIDELLDFMVHNLRRHTGGVATSKKYIHQEEFAPWVNVHLFDPETRRSWAVSMPADELTLETATTTCHQMRRDYEV